jgi:hypothetical protein
VLQKPLLLLLMFTGQLARLGKHSCSVVDVEHSRPDHAGSLRRQQAVVGATILWAGFLWTFWRVQVQLPGSPPAAATRSIYGVRQVCVSSVQ